MRESILRPVLGLVLALVSLYAFAAHAGKSQPMSVLFVISDDLRNEIGGYDSELARTPQLDAQAATGVRFDRAHYPYPLCNTTRSSMRTGRRPPTTGVIGSRTWFGAEHPDFVILPTHFRQQGYVTLQSGKIFHGGIDDTLVWSEGGNHQSSLPTL